MVKEQTINNIDTENWVITKTLRKLPVPFAKRSDCLNTSDGSIDVWILVGIIPATNPVEKSRTTKFTKSVEKPELSNVNSVPVIWLKNGRVKIEIGFKKKIW